MGMGINQIKQKAVPVLKKEGVIRSAIFGSYAWGEAREDSDIDILVEFPKGKSFFDLIRLERELKKTLEKEVDVITYNSIHPLLKDIILREQIQIL